MSKNEKYANSYMTFFQLKMFALRIEILVALFIAVFVVVAAVVVVVAAVVFVAAVVVVV